MLQEFKRWVTQNTEYNIIVNENELTTSMVIDFENDFYIARFTVWDDFSCMSEILDVNTRANILDQRNEFSSISELLDVFQIFANKLN